MPRAVGGGDEIAERLGLAARRQQRGAAPQRGIGPEVHLAAAQEADAAAAGVREHVARRVVGGGQGHPVDARPVLQVVEHGGGAGVGEVGREAVERRQHWHHSLIATATTLATSTSSSTRTNSALECAWAKSPGP